MMFDKNNTNFNGECLCKSCKYVYPVEFYGENYTACGKTNCIVKNVGVCNEYVELKKDI